MVLIKRLTLGQLNKRNLNNLLYIKKIIRKRWRKHAKGAMDKNSYQKAGEYAEYLRDIQGAIALIVEKS